MIHLDLKHLLNARDIDIDLDIARDRDLDIDLARDIARDLDIDLARNLTRDIARALARDIARAHDIAHDIDRDLSHDLSRAHDIDRALSRARDIARDLAHDHARDLTLARDLALVGALARDIDLARDLARDLTLVGARDLTRALDLVGAIEAARQMVTPIAAALSASAATAGGPVQGDSGGVQPGRVAVGVVQRMVRVLPTGDRARYRQEFLAELHALAQEQASRRVQLGHVLRAAAGMWSLRRVLRGPRPGRERAR